MDFSSNDFNSHSLRQSDVMMDPSAFFHFHLLGLNCAIVHHLEVSADGWTTFIPMKIVSTRICDFFPSQVHPVGLAGQRTRGLFFKNENRPRANRIFVFHPGNAENPLQRQEKLSSNSNVPLPLRASGASPKKKNIPRNLLAQPVRARCFQINCSPRAIYLNELMLWPATRLHRRAARGKPFGCCR